MPGIQGLKICWAGNGVSEYPDILRVPIKRSETERYIYSLCFEPGHIGGGGNSGFQALNLAVHFGAKQIVLVGFDMHDRGGPHWYGRNTWTAANNPDSVAFNRWIAGFERAAKDLRRSGIEVFNLGVGSSLRCFPFLTPAEALSVFRRHHDKP